MFIIKMSKYKFSYDILNSDPLTNDEYEEVMKRSDEDYKFCELPELKNFSAYSYCVL